MASYPEVNYQHHRTEDSSDNVGDFVLTPNLVHTILTFIHKIAASGVDGHVFIHDTLAFEGGLDFVPEFLLAAHDDVFILCPWTLGVSVTLEVRMKTDIFGCALEIVWVCAGLALRARLLAGCLAIVRVFILFSPL